MSAEKDKEFHPGISGTLTRTFINSPLTPLLLLAFTLGVGLSPSVRAERWRPPDRSPPCRKAISVIFSRRRYGWSRP